MLIQKANKNFTCRKTIDKLDRDMDIQFLVSLMATLYVTGKHENISEHSGKCIFKSYIRQIVLLAAESQNFGSCLECNYLILSSNIRVI